MPAITFDGPNKIIDIGYDSPFTTVTVADIYSRWKDWVSSDNAQYQPAFSDSVGGNDLGGGLFLDGYYFLRNDLGWRIRAADQDHELVIDGQLFGFAPSTTVYLGRAGRTITYRFILSSRSQIVLPDSTPSETASQYQGVVYLDPNSSFSGTTPPNGTSVQPVNNMAAAVTIAGNLGLRRILVESSLSVGENVSGLNIEGLGRPTLTILPGANVLGTLFKEMNIEGTMDGDTHIFSCEVGNLDGVSGQLDQVLLGGTISVVDDTALFNCSSHIPGNGAPTLDFMSTNAQCQVRSYSGSLRVSNMAPGSVLSFDVISGRLIIDASCTGGTIKLRGVGEPYEDYSGGAVTVDSDGFVSGTDYDRIVTETSNRIIPQIYAV